MNTAIISKAQKRRLLCLAAFVGMGLFCVTPQALAQSGDVQSRMNRLENEIETLSRAIFKGEEPPAGSLSSPSSDAARAALEVRINQLETELRALTGQIEQQGFDIRKLQEEITTLKSQPQEATMTQMGRPMGTNPLSESLYGQQQSNGVINQPPPENMSAMNHQQVAQPTAATPQAAGQLGTLTQPQTAAGKAPYTTASVSDNPTEVYEAAFSMVRDGYYDQAESGLTDFLTRFPEHTLAPNARYWLGETYYVRKEYPKAARVFADAYQKSPKGAKGPDNLLKLGLSLAGMGKTQDACVALKQLQTEYSGTANPVIDRAGKEMATLNCP